MSDNFKIEAVKTSKCGEFRDVHEFSIYQIPTIETEMILSDSNHLEEYKTYVLLHFDDHKHVEYLTEEIREYKSKGYKIVTSKT